MTPTSEQWKLIANACSSHAELATARAAQILGGRDHHAERRLHEAGLLIREANEALALAKVAAECHLDLACEIRKQPEKTPDATEPLDSTEQCGAAVGPELETSRKVRRRGGKRTAAAPD